MCQRHVAATWTRRNSDVGARRCLGHSENSALSARFLDLGERTGDSRDPPGEAVPRCICEVSVGWPGCNGARVRLPGFDRMISLIFRLARPGWIRSRILGDCGFSFRVSMLIGRTGGRSNRLSCFLRFRLYWFECSCYCGVFVESFC